MEEIRFEQIFFALVTIALKTLFLLPDANPAVGENPPGLCLWDDKQNPGYSPLKVFTMDCIISHVSNYSIIAPTE